MVDKSVTKNFYFWRAHSSPPRNFCRAPLSTKKKSKSTEYWGPERLRTWGTRLQDHRGARNSVLYFVLHSVLYSVVHVVWYFALHLHAAGATQTAAARRPKIRFEGCYFWWFLKKTRQNSTPLGGEILDIWGGNTALKMIIRLRRVETREKFKNIRNQRLRNRTTPRKYFLRYGTARKPIFWDVEIGRVWDGPGGFEPGRWDLGGDSRDPGRIFEIFMKIPRIFKNFQGF